MPTFVCVRAWSPCCQPEDYREISRAVTHTRFSIIYKRARRRICIMNYDYCCARRIIATSEAMRNRSQRPKQWKECGAFSAIILGACFGLCNCRQRWNYNCCKFQKKLEILAFLMHAKRLFLLSLILNVNLLLSNWFSVGEKVFK